MTKYYKCDVCHKEFMTQEFLDKHIRKVHPEVGDPSEPKSRGWATPYGFLDASYPITYKVACEQMKSMSKDFSDMFENETQN